MASTSKEATADILDESISGPPNARANTAPQSPPISVENPPAQKNKDLWSFNIREHAFSEGPDLTFQDYLRLRVLWYTWPDQTSFQKYKPDNPALSSEESQNPPCTGYISPESDRIADAIYEAVNPEIKAYLKGIRRVGNEHSNRSSTDYGIFDHVRHWNYMISTNVPEEYDENEKKLHFRRKVHKTEAGLPQKAGVTSALDAGDVPNLTSCDEYGVYTALCLMLRAIHSLLLGLLKEDCAAPLAAAELSKVRGLKYLHWLPSHLRLHLTDRSSGSAPPKQLIEARIGGSLCREVFVRASDNGEEEELKPSFNALPLAVFDAKPFTRLSASSATRWQESAEIAAWVSELDDRFENVGLLHSSESGRKRRLLISQGRHELWIIIAEYGEQWKQYVRGINKTSPVEPNQPQNVKDSAGTEGPVTAKDTGLQLEPPGPEHFCTMQEWGPYNTGDADHMDCFIRWLIGFEVELVQNWPAEEFQHPEPS